MPFLMVNLDDTTDCQRAMRQLRRHLRHSGVALPGGDCGPAPNRKRGPGGKMGEQAPLKQKLQRIRQRGVWRFLDLIANLDDTARSLPELDEALGLQRNKMRSTKAIFAKLENRLDVRFLVVDEDAGEDESGNPRYVMPPRIRKIVLKLA
ncbi:MAG: hypothetical protein AB8B91_16120 [Rubripirellula sp.]